ncbi:MAG: hypothetical protein M1839_009428 [Geoglossum umbratile]|nr:MAG: hypothetical protein M1839_009428 [Geoglossum umbratile]
MDLVVGFLPHGVLRCRWVAEIESIAVTIAFDVIIFSIPIPLLAKVQIKPRRKYALIGVFLLGLFTTVCSVLRMIQIIRISRDGNSTGLVLWGTIEMNVGVCNLPRSLLAPIDTEVKYKNQISLTCLPSLTPLFKHIAKLTTAYGSDNSKDSYNLESLARGHSSVHRPQRSGSKPGRTNGSKDSILCDNNSLYQPPSPPGSMGNDSSRGVMGFTKMTELDIKVIPTSMVMPDEKERVSKHHSGSGAW